MKLRRRLHRDICDIGNPAEPRIGRVASLQSVFRFAGNGAIDDSAGDAGKVDTEINWLVLCRWKLYERENLRMLLV